MALPLFVRVVLETGFTIESSTSTPSSLDASSPLFVIAMAYRKSSLVQPYTIALKNPCRGVVRDWREREKGGSGKRGI